MALSSGAVKAVALAMADRDDGKEVAVAINNGDAVARLASHVPVKLIVATSTSTTTDFGALVVGDKVLMVPAVAGNSIFYTVATAGTLPAAAVIGNLYVVLRAVSLPADTAAVAVF
jgi:hypothetical protein